MTFDGIRSGNAHDSGKELTPFALLRRDGVTEMKKLLVILAVVLMSVVIAGRASAGSGTGGAPRMGSLSGSQETGTADPDGSGSAMVTLNVGQDRVCWAVTWADIDTPSAYHIHHAPAGVAGPVVLPFTVGGAFVPSGCRSGLDDPALLQDIIDFPDQYYVNVHNAAFPGGAIRGQLSVPGQAS